MMTERYLILQVLGTSDITLNKDSEELWKRLSQGSSLENIEYHLETVRLQWQNNRNIVNFPLIEKLWQKFKEQDCELFFGIILSDQEEWASKKYGTNHPVWKLVAKDGIYGKDFLEQWFKDQNLKYYLWTFKIEEQDNFDYGMADWEAIDNKITPFLNNYIEQGNDNLSLKDISDDNNKIDKIIIQHSSGTPAITSALYLWGIEQKLAGYPIEFIYISEEEDKCLKTNNNNNITHSVEHWQWHLQLPLIRKLLKIKDFSGALALVENIPESNPLSQRKKEIIKELQYLDNLVSFNIKKPKDQAELDIRGEIIARIAIALWTEKDFRERGHWMDWYLRVAGALESAILLLLETQSNGQYEWRDSVTFPKLMFIKKQENIKQEISKISISDIVTKLLTNGELELKKEGILLKINNINDQSWNNSDKAKKTFKKFYCDNWDLGELSNNLGKSGSEENQVGFLTLRNKLFHSLCGDRIDRLLDLKTEELENILFWLIYFFRWTIESGSYSSMRYAFSKCYQLPKHPAAVAVSWLEYIIKLVDSNETKDDKKIGKKIHKNLDDYQTKYNELYQKLF